MIVESGDGSLRVVTSVQDDWGSGHVGIVEIVNLGSTAIDGWRLDFSAPFTISNLWNGRIVESAGGSYGVVDAGWNGTIQPGQSVSFGYQAGPVGSGPESFVLNGVALGGGGGPALPALAVGDVTVAEGDSGTTDARFTVTLSQPSDDPVTVRYETAPGSATGDDFVAASGELTIPAGETAGEIVVEVSGDTEVEPDETFELRLADPVGATIDDGVGTGTITNDDAVVPAVAVGDVVVAEGDAGSTDAVFELTLDRATSVETRVAFRTEDGSATAGNDYEAASGEVVFVAGETAATVPVAVLGDQDPETDETFRLLLEDGDGLVIADGIGEATIIDDDQAASLPVVDVADGVLDPGDPGGGSAAGFFGTSGNQIVDSAGSPVKLAGVNWFGMETARYAPDGLFTRNYKDMMDQMVELGFNTIRLPFSNDALDPGRMPADIDYGLNPELAGLTSLEVLDAIVDHAGAIGLRIILDNHRINAGDGAEGIWFGNGSSEADWIADWQALAARYAGNPTVIGADLFNEPHLGRWGDPANPEPDFWNVAAEKAGNAIHAVNPDWLILVEGVGDYQGDFYWWGGQLKGVADFPVELDQPGKLVYSPHAYPNSIFAQPWFSAGDFPDNLPAKWTETWGFIHQQEIAPVLLGEFGSRFQDPKDLAWLDGMQDYLAGDFDGDGASDLAPGELGPSWTWWSWNPNSGDTGGILEDDWQTPIQAKLDLLEPLMFDLQTVPGGGGEPAEITFEVTLSEPSSDEVRVDYETADDTAIAGEDYLAQSGTLAIAAGETKATVTVTVLEGGDGAFRLLLSDPDGATLGDAEALGSIDGSTGGGGGGGGGGGTTEEGLLLDLDLRDDWGSGFVADVSVTNQGSSPIDAWAFLLEMPNDIVDIWSADLVEDRGDAYVIDNAPWNGALAPGATAVLGFQGAGTLDLSEVDLTPLVS